MVNNKEPLCTRVMSLTQEMLIFTIGCRWTDGEGRSGWRYLSLSISSVVHVRAVGSVVSAVTSVQHTVLEKHMEPSDYNSISRQIEMELTII